MSKWPQLSRAPIVEGLIDIRVEPSAGATIDALKSCADSLAAEFPSREEMRSFLGEFTFSPERGPSFSAQAPGPIGVALRSPDQKWVAQFRLDGFTLSRLEPYTAWVDLVARVQELWTKYKSAAQPAKIIRVATRFINRIPLPPGESFEKTFTSTFTIASSLPQFVAGYLLRVVIPFEKEGAMAIFTQSLDGNRQDCVFDIDAFVETPGGLADAQAWDKLEMLHGIKNQLFFESLTEEALERFK